jgi:hypothetical protein
MSPMDDQLRRLFRAARPMAEAPDFAAPFGLETRVLAAWRERRSRSGMFWSEAQLVRGMVLAVVLALVSLLPEITSSSAASANPYSDFQQLADSTLTTDDSP